MDGFKMAFNFSHMESFVLFGVVSVRRQQNVLGLKLAQALADEVFRPRLLLVSEGKHVRELDHLGLEVRELELGPERADHPLADPARGRERRKPRLDLL